LKEGSLIGHWRYKCKKHRINSLCYLKTGLWKTSGESKTRDLPRRRSRKTSKANPARDNTVVCIPYNEEDLLCEPEAGSNLGVPSEFL